MLFALSTISFLFSVSFFFAERSSCFGDPCLRVFLRLPDLVLCDKSESREEDEEEDEEDEEAEADDIDSSACDWEVVGRLMCVGSVGPGGILEERLRIRGELQRRWMVMSAEVWEVSWSLYFVRSMSSVAMRART